MNQQRRRTVLKAVIGISLWAGFVPLETVGLADDPPKARLGTAFELPRLELDEGTAQEAVTYYTDFLSPHLGFLTPSTIISSHLQELLTYFGYPDVTPKELHSKSSADLMALGVPGEILATRWFAPKITDVADRPQSIPAEGFGWRKLVRLRARQGSDAEMNKMESMFVLQNQFGKDATSEPFAPEKDFAKFIQVIVVRKETIATGQHPAYFLAYGPLIKLDENDRPLRDAAGNFFDHGELATHLQATFDEKDRDPETNLDPRNYFVPRSCRHCHGGAAARVKLNFLDTDHVQDRVVPQYGIEAAAGPHFATEDFTALANSPFGVLYDGGKDPTTPEFAQAFAVIRKINEEIHSQNMRADQANPSFQQRAVEKWLALHTSNVGHVPPYKRGFGDEPWNENLQTHRKLVYFLNRYCYRCHSSIKFSTFDRAEVKARASQIRLRVTDVNNSGLWMPQDRIFPGLVKGTDAMGQPIGVPAGQLTEFLDLITELQNEP